MHIIWPLATNSITTVTKMRNCSWMDDDGTIVSRKTTLIFVAALFKYYCNTFLTQVQINHVKGFPLCILIFFKWMMTKNRPSVKLFDKLIISLRVNGHNELIYYLKKN